MIRSVDIQMLDLPNELNVLLSEGYGVVCMYATEEGLMPHSIQTILRKTDKIIHITTPLDSYEYPSMSIWMPSLLPYEREMQEMNGLRPKGFTNYGPQRIMWKYDDGYPLQKDELPKERTEVPIPGNNIVGEGVFEIPVGPVHAGIIEPGHFRFSVAGEPIIKVTAHLGFTYRGIEKLLETTVLKDNIRIVERISGDTAVANSLAYAHAIEGDMEVPYRAQLLRVIFSELERIQCHFGDISGMAKDTGFAVPAATCAGIREKILRLNEMIGGHRFLMGTIVPGGVRRDISDNSLKAIEKRMLKIDFDLEDLMRMLDNSTLFTDRAETTGIVTKEIAEELRALGPTARASGIKTDIRKERPYDAYKKLGMRLYTADKGDVRSRLTVKAGEIVESVSLINQCLDRMEKGELRTEVNMQDGFNLGIVEAPRGELMHAVNVVNGNIWRYKIRDPSFINWLVLEHALPGNIVPDFPLINKSFNLSYSGNDL
ncbi:MAG: NADH-quinone oxidoreductase subunit C [Candidatus Methanomethylophilaceae archaeon]|nr:NADH-quinone oxidoreductase subunit C [Candidatus Methanomethylophilaceae archaeon]MDY0224574.1 NADH-quinone oxidoreductase subunit C [Candidatus Methanomethylophilaceae archaeon]